VGAKNGDGEKERPDEQEGEEEREGNCKTVEEGRGSREFALGVGDAGESALIGVPVPEFKSRVCGVKGVGLVEAEGIELGDHLLD